MVSLGRLDPGPIHQSLLLLSHPLGAMEWHWQSDSRHRLIRIHIATFPSSSLGGCVYCHSTDSPSSTSTPAFCSVWQSHILDNRKSRRERRLEKPDNDYIFLFQSDSMGGAATKKTSESWIEFGFSTHIHPSNSQRVWWVFAKQIFQICIHPPENTGHTYLCREGKIWERKGWLEF